MKRTFTRIILTLFFLANLCSGFAQSEKNTIRVLAIGNSFSQDAVENYLYELADAEDVNLIIGNAHIGGCTLRQHRDYAVGGNANYYFQKIVEGKKENLKSNQTLESCLSDEPWDYISFQQASQNSGLYDTYFPYLDELLTYVKGKVTNPNVKYALHQTWAYAEDSSHSGFVNYNNSQITMYNAIIDATHRVKEAVPDISLIIPAGTAIQNGRTSAIGDNFCRDGYHLDIQIGRYTVACTWFEKITGINVVGNTSKPASLGDFQVSVAQHAAHFAVLEPEEVTQMVDFMFDPGNTTPLEHPINISFGNAATTSNWNSLTNVNNAAVYGLKDSAGNDTKIIFKVNDAFSGINGNGPETTNTIMSLPTDVSKSSFFGNEVVFSGKTEPTGGFEISNLNKNYTYDFVMFSSRTGATNNRETYFTVKGKNEGTATVNASGNTDKTAEVIGIRPDADGNINITVGAGANNNDGNKFFYINAMQIAAKEFIPSEKDTIRILAVGNSFSQDAVENYLYELAAAEDVHFIIGSAIIGGCSLESHNKYAETNAANYAYCKIVNGNKTNKTGQTLKSCLSDESWDYISFQQVSQNSGLYNTYFPYLPNLLNYAKGEVSNPEVKYILHQTWAYAQENTHNGFANYNNSQQIMYDSIIATTSRVKENVEEIAFVIPSGTAIQNGRTSAVGDNFCRDGYHLDVQIGRYTAACTWFEKITGINVVGNKAKPSGLTDFLVSVAQNAAHFAVLEPEKVTPMDDFLVNPEKTFVADGIKYRLTEGVNTVEVAHPGNESNPSTYAGDIVIPSQVTDATGTVYTVTGIGYRAFRRCASTLTSITLPATLTSIGEAAFIALPVASIDLPNTITSIEKNAFSEAKFTEIALPSNLTVIGETAFNDCLEITNLVIPEGVTEIPKSAFKQCKKLVSVTLPSRINSIGQDAFANCLELTQIICKAENPPVIYNNTKNSVFWSIPADCKVYVPENSVETYRAAEGWKDFGTNGSNIIGESMSAVPDINETTLIVTPNPVLEKLHIKSPEIIDCIELYDTSGKRIMQMSGINKNEAQMNFSHLKNGFYLLRARTSNNVILMDKIIKL